MLVGGLRPRGASRAVVEGERAVADNGAWIAILDSIDVHGEVAARYEAGDGAIVRPALPARWAREPVPDADEPCPACGALTWERVTPTDKSRGYSRSSGGRMLPSAVIVCTRCGHEVPGGTWHGAGAPRAPWRLLRGVRYRFALRWMRPPAIDALDFPVYALAGGDAEPAGHSWDRKGVHSMTMRNDRVAITTEAGREALVEAGEESARTLMSVIHNAEPMGWGSGSNAARALRIQAQRRAVAARVSRAEPFIAELPVDGAPVRFAGLRDQAGWAAVGDTAQVRIVIAARGIEPGAVALRKL
jgi:hypothetical protein